MHLLLLLLLPACFLPPWTQAGEIIQGQEAIPHSRPYMACLKGSKKEFGCTCGGFLIREDFVLTAAHCLKRPLNIVILGAHNVSESESTQQDIPVSRAFPHKNFERKTFSNDIMLLKLVRKAKLTPAVQLLRLPSPGTQLQQGEKCNVAGWGNTSGYFWQYTDTLHEVDLAIQNDDECLRLFKMMYKKGIQLCAGDPKTTKDSAEGDSGGPLVCNNEAHGIVSYGISGYPPGVYTKISAYLNWIEAQIEGHKGS